MPSGSPNPPPCHRHTKLPLSRCPLPRYLRGDCDRDAMPDFIHDIPLATLAAWFSLVAVGAIVVGLLVIKPILRVLIGGGPDLNESLSYGTASFSLFYGLLLGLLTVSAYQNNDRIAQAILNEATSLSALYADMNVYPEPMRSEMRTMLRDYTLFTIHKDWPAHRQGSYLDGGENRSNAMRQKLASFEPETRGQEIVHAQVLGSFQQFVEARQQRLVGVYMKIPDVLW